MKICWDYLEGVYLRADGDFQKGDNTYIYKDACKECGNSFLTTKQCNSEYCCRSCAQTGKRNHRFGKGYLGSANPMWNGGFNKKGLASFKVYEKEMSFFEDVRDSLGVLEVKCVYCGRWFKPHIYQVADRLRYIRGIKEFEAKFYCSDNCKRACPVFNQKKYPKGFRKASSREVQPELRQLVLQRDAWTCQYGNCGKTIDESELHCHHFEGIEKNPVESADIDNCITLCKEHHKKVHSEKGCRYTDFVCNRGGLYEFEEV
jgi:5-methylcytosine-specific restriction endonuclease McrA